MPPISITESEPAVLALSTAQAAAIQEAGRRLVSDKSWWGGEDLAPERTAIRCEPTQDGQWRVTVVNAVGLIALGDTLQISVLPKIPTSHLLYLFAASGRFPKLDQQRGLLTHSASLWDLVADWFVTALEGTVRRDLRRDYEVITDELTQLRGTIDPLRSATAYYAGRIALTCEFDDFNVDTPLNRVLRAAALIVVRSADLTTVLRRRARTMLARMEDVGALRPADLRMQVDRCTAHYADSVLLAHHVLVATGRTFEAGGLSARTFLIRTPEAVEEGLRQILVRQLPGIDVVKRGRQLPPTSLTLTPDLLFDQGRAVADIKY